MQQMHQQRNGNIELSLELSIDTINDVFDWRLFIVPII